MWAPSGNSGFEEQTIVPEEGASACRSGITIPPSLFRFTGSGFTRSLLFTTFIVTSFRALGHEFCATLWAL